MRYGGKIVKILEQLCLRHTGATRSKSSSVESTVSTGAVGSISLKIS